MCTIENCYTSVACNRTTEIADWDSNTEKICYGASNAVLIYDRNIQNGDPITTLCHHKAQVNCVKWLQTASKEKSEIISASNDNTIAVWSICNDVWKVSHELRGHNNVVKSVDGAYFGSDLLVCSSSVDSTVNFWMKGEEEFKCIQTIELGSGLCIAIKVTKLPKINKPLILLSLNDEKIHLYVDTFNDGCGDGCDRFRRVASFGGHEDWVQGIDVLNCGDENILIATSSQDTHIRLWKVEMYKEQPKVLSGELHVESKKFLAYGKEWTYELESVLSGHDGWVYSVKWSPGVIENEIEKPAPRLLSASLDKTLIIWERETAGSSEDVWIEKVRLGEVGGNGLGFYGACFGPNGTSVLAHGYNGSFHIWDNKSGDWLPSPVVGGHFNEVVDLRWEPRDGRYLISCSTDQTTRLHALWICEQKKSKEWHEIARPQVHGYDMSCLTSLNAVTLVSGAEEKILRVFQATNNFIENFSNICGCKLDVDKGFIEPPTEETLMQNTLWVEIQKLYGHGYELFALDSSPDEEFLASASRATSTEHAAIIIWDTKTWRQTQKLTSHNLTVTQLSFSHDSQKLLSVSRDRRWSVFTRSDNFWSLAACSDKTNGVHSRIIWCCAWAFDDSVFATGSRDGKLCIWGQRSQSSLGCYGLVRSPLEVSKSSITAVCFAPIDRIKLIAIGYESGLIDLYHFNEDTDVAWNIFAQLSNNTAHHLTVRRLCFRPSSGKTGSTEDKNTLQLASCGNDRMLRIYNVVLR